MLDVKQYMLIYHKLSIQKLFLWRVRLSSDFGFLLPTKQKTSLLKTILYKLLELIYLKKMLFVTYLKQNLFFFFLSSI